MQYQINSEFRNEVLQIADVLDLDEIDSASLYLRGQEEAELLDRSPTVSAIIRFHQRRQFLLECLHLTIKLPQEDEIEDEGIRDYLQATLRKVLQFGDGQLDNGSKYWQKCLSAMADLESWLHRVAEQSQRASVVGASFSTEGMEILEFQRSSLTTQHESLAAIATHLIKDYTQIDDFSKLLHKVRLLDKHDIIMIHYLPILMRCIWRFGSSESTTTNEEIEKLCPTILADKDQAATWSLQTIHSATIIWWYSETTGRGIEIPPAADAEKGQEADNRFKRFMNSIRAGALHFMLSVAQDIRRSEWHDPVKKATVDFLLEDTVKLPSESLLPSEDFQTLLMAQYQNFSDAFITNMPDTLRRLRLEEDENRRQLRSRFQRGPVEYQAHLERFLVITSYAFDRDTSSAADFWGDKDGNLYGFLQWSAKRQTTPRVAAFCEMLRSISQDEKSANEAHNFLLEEGTPIAGRLRRTGSLSWTQIVAELDYFAANLRDKQPAAQSSGTSAPSNNIVEQILEPESTLMLECYLRLVTHLCTQSRAVREWVLTYNPHGSQNQPNSPPSNLTHVLFFLAGSHIESRLRSSAFSTLAAILIQKNFSTGNSIWTSLDCWIATGLPMPSLQAKVPASGSQNWTEKKIFDHMTVGYEEPNAFIRLLNALVAPYASEADLNDALPFPEDLGKSHRMPGINAYVDFTVGRIFADKSLLLPDVNDQRLLRLNCLDFIATCLSTFNEDLVVLANRTNLAVESAMRTSSLETYVRLHPFARVMEWVYTDKALAALFSTTHQNIEEVNNSASDSPFVLSIIRSIEVMNLIFQLQPIFLDIVKPLVRTQMGDRRLPVPSGAISSFEDAVLNNLDLIVDLGLYCGTGHQELIVSSLALLEKLSSSRKLTVVSTAGFGKRSDRSKLIGILEKDGEAERISRSLVSVLQIDGRELEAGDSSPGYVIKTHILTFLLHCLEAMPDKPSVAHLLLGFECASSEVAIAPDSLFANAMSLFHAVVGLALEFPGVLDGSYWAWLTNIQATSLDILQLLWVSPLSSGWTMSDLRAMDFVFSLAIRQDFIQSSTLWDGKPITAPDFIFDESAIALNNFLRSRRAFLDVFAREMRVAAKEGMSRVRQRLSETFLGSTTFPGEEAVPNPTIFDLFDFMELDIPGAPQLPELYYISHADFAACAAEGEGGEAYNLSIVEEMLLLKRSELEKSGELYSDEQRALYEKEHKLAFICLLGINQQRQLHKAHTRTLRSWVYLVVVALECGDFDARMKSSICLQTLQLVLPKLESSFNDNPGTALQLADLVRSLLHYADFDQANENLGLADSSSDRLFQVFRAALNGAYSHAANVELREICYSICLQYLRHAFPPANDKSVPRRRLVLRTVKLSGDRLVDTICDDAYSGMGNCRIAALLLLEALVSFASLEDSKYMLESFARLNFVGVLVDGVKNIPTEIGGAQPADIDSVFATLTANLAMLLRVAQSRLGAAQVLNTGLFQAVRDSQLFSADPDIGFEIESPHSLNKFFTLMLAVLRIINSVVISRGRQNEQTMGLARSFLKEYRQTIVGIFKRHAAIGVASLQVLTATEDGAKKEKVELSELVDGFTLLMSVTGFLEVCGFPKSAFHGF